MSPSVIQATDSGIRRVAHYKTALHVALAAAAIVAIMMIVGELRRDASHTTKALGVGVRVVWLLLFAWLARVVGRLHWGEDVTWFAGRWVPTREVSELVGLADARYAPVVEHRDSHKGVIFWCATIGLLALVTIPGAALHYAEEPLYSASAFIGACVVLVFLAHTTLTTFSRVIRMDDAGFSDGSVFEIRRVPWGALAHFNRVNLNAAAQRDYDLNRHRAGRSSSSRPIDLWVWKLLSADGEEIVRLDDVMAPPEAFAQLRAKIGEYATVEDGRSDLVMPSEDDEEDEGDA